MTYAPERIGIIPNERGQWLVYRPGIDKAPYAEYIHADKYNELLRDFSLLTELILLNPHKTK